MWCRAVHPPWIDADTGAVTQSRSGLPETGDLSGVLGAVLVSYAWRALGQSGVSEVMDRVGAEHVLSLVESPDEWVPIETVLATAIAVAELCHEPDIGWRAGEELFRVLVERGLLVLPGALTLCEAFPLVVESVNTSTDLRLAEVLSCDDGEMVVAVHAKPEGTSRFLCRVFGGFYSLVPSLRQATGTVVERACVNRGDAHCEFVVRWRAPSDAFPGHDPFVERIERLHDWAAKVAAADETSAEAVLEAAVLLDEFRKQALTDPLTGLANRAHLMARAARESEARDGSLDGLTLLFVDLDGFKGINDELGHAAGDELLVQLAARLRGAVRGSDLVARLGGDEFVVLFPDVDDGAVPRLVGKVSSVFNQPFVLGNHAVDLQGSLGISRAPDHGTTFDDLLAFADGEMYRVKRSRGRR